MKYLSVCSGIEAATVAWHPLGWTPVGFGEIEKFPCQVLAHHYPDVTNFGDMTRFKEWNFESDVNVLVGGTPCQSFSVAGLRKGLDDPRGNLMLTYLAIAAKHRPQWLVWENVPGVLSSNGGLDFASLLRGMGELGYGFAYRILDAQYFGVAQRRRRVFVVGYLGNWRPAAAVLFERHSLCGYPAPSREERKRVASFTPSSIGGYSEGVGTLRAHGGDIGGGSENLVATQHSQVVPTVFAADLSQKAEGIGYAKEQAPCLTSGTHPGHGVHVHVTAQPIPIDTMNHLGRGDKHSFGDFMPGAPSYTLTKHHSHAVAQPIPIDMMNIRERPSDDGRANRIGRGYGEVGDPMFTITKANHHAICLMDQGGSVMTIENDMTGTLRRETHGHEPVVMAFDWQSGGDSRGLDPKPTAQLQSCQTPAVMQAMAVRRLTPVECERLQGFPDGYTDIQPKGKATPDGPRYKALGNSMAVPVMRWIGKRIQEVEGIA